MSTEDKGVVIKNADMSEDMKQHAIEIAFTALSQHEIEKDIAAYIKKRFDEVHGPTWHCIVGRGFGSFITHEANSFIYFYMKASKQAVLLFKAG
eukprot:g8792.t1